LIVQETALVIAAFNAWALDNDAAALFAVQGKLHKLKS
jgi:hypothetical protein